MTFLDYGTILCTSKTRFSFSNFSTVLWFKTKGKKKKKRKKNLNDQNAYKTCIKKTDISICNDVNNLISAMKEWKGSVVYGEGRQCYKLQDLRRKFHKSIIVIPVNEVAKGRGIEFPLSESCLNNARRRETKVDRKRSEGKLWKSSKALWA